jgi:hypothetical protein
MIRVLALVLLLSQAASAQVVNICGAGKNCRMRTATITGTQGTVLTIPSLTSFGVGACGMSANGSNLLVGVGTCNLVGPGGSQLLLGGGVFLANAALTTSFTTASAFVGSATLMAETTANRLYRADGARWNRVAAGTHPIYDAPTYTVDVGQGANTPEWQYAPKNAAGSAVTIVEGCTGGTLAAGSRISRFNGRSSSSRNRTTSAVANATCGWVTSLVGKASNLRPNMSGVLTAPGALTSVRQIWGFGPDALFSAPADTPTVEGAWFRFSSAAGDTALMACTSNGVSAATCTSTGVTVSAGQALDVEIDDYTESAAITFWVNGNARVRVTSNLPAGTADVEFGSFVQTLSAATRNYQSGNTALEITL